MKKRIEKKYKIDRAELSSGGRRGAAASYYVTTDRSISDRQAIWL